MKSRADHYCDLLNDLNERCVLFEEYTNSDCKHIAAEATRLLYEKFEEIDVIIWNEKTQKFEVRK